MKTCITCNIEKELSEYYGHKNSCKNCVNEKRKCKHGKFKCKKCIEEKKLSIENEEKEEQINEEIKLCTNCNIEKKISDFYKNHGRCKECYNISRKCEHNIYIESCEECKNIGKCEIHSLKKCMECNTLKICINCNIEKNINEFRKNRNDCKKCEKIKNKCEHNIRKEYCLDCIDGGSALCIHKIRKSRCKECEDGGSALCKQHGKYKFTCIECNPNVSLRCKGQEGLCTTLATVKKLRGYCAYCFFFTFPDEPITRNYKTKENSVTDYIKEKFKKYDIIFDKTIQGGCSKKRPDILFHFGDKVIIVEVDENQHKNYDTTCEKVRVNNLLEDINYRNLVLIKFNPDYYKLGLKQINSPWKMNNKNGILEIINKKEWNKRLNTLQETINHYINNDITELFTMINLFYDE